MREALGNGGWSGVAIGDHDSFYSAQTAMETGRKDKNETLALARPNVDRPGRMRNALHSFASRLLLLADLCCANCLVLCSLLLAAHVLSL